MITLSIRQPWAWLIIRPDIVGVAARAQAAAAGLIKDCENRDWHTQYRGRMLVHAGKTMTKGEYRDATAFAMDVAGIKLPPADQLQFGGVVGSVEVTDCVRASRSRWFLGEFGFMLREPVAVTFTPWKGQLGFFDVPKAALLAAAVPGIFQEGYES